VVSGDDKLVRVRGHGPNGFRYITLADWKKENAARRGKVKKIKRRRDTRMEAKLKRRVQKRAKVKDKEKNK